MAERQIEVLHQWHGGVLMKQASEEEMKKAGEAWRALRDKWKADGIEMIAQFSSPSGVGDFPHFILWRLKCADQYFQMADDAAEAKDLTKIIERYRLTLGRGPAPEG